MNRLKDLREKRGISIRKLAEQVGISHTQISRIERGEQAMSVPHAVALADYFGVSVDYLTKPSNKAKTKNKPVPTANTAKEPTTQNRANGAPTRA